MTRNSSTSLGMTTLGRCAFAVGVCLLGKADVFARFHFEIESQRIGRVRLDNFLHEFYEDWVLAKNGVLIHRFEINGDEERPGRFRIDSFAALDAEDLGNFEKLHPGIHHHLLNTGWSDFGFELVENDVMNHPAKGIRRLRLAAQVGMRCEKSVLLNRHQA